MRSARPIATLALLLAVATSAHAREAPARIYEKATAALLGGSFEEALAHFESLDEEGFTHPDASYNRAVAYVARAETEQKRPGDLGRAAAALRETLSLRPGDADAEVALERVREEIVRRRNTRTPEPFGYDESLTRALAGLASEDTWCMLSLFGSLLLSVGLTLAVWVRRPNTRVPAMLAIGVGAALLTLSGSLAALSRHFRVSESIGVVVVPEARLLDERALPLTGGAAGAVPEGAEVRVTEQRAALARIEWGRTAAFVLRNQLRILRRP